MKPIFIIAIAGFFAISCTKDQLSANGNISSEIRTPGNFNGIEANGANKVTITQGPDLKVELRGSSNLIPRFKTKIFNGTLILGYERVNIQDDDIQIFITMPELESVATSGSGDLDVFGSFPFNNLFKVKISGSSDILIRDEFIVDELNMSLSGSGNLEADKISAQEADVKISGSGDVRLKVQNKLKVRISGSGKVLYKGNPTIDSQISGSGSVVPF